MYVIENNIHSNLCDFDCMTIQHLTGPNLSQLLKFVGWFLQAGARTTGCKTVARLKKTKERILMQHVELPYNLHDVRPRLYDTKSFIFTFCVVCFVEI